MNAPDRNLHDAADGQLRAQAIESLSEKIKGGRSRVTVHDLIDAELDDHKRNLLLVEQFSDLVGAESGERAALADAIVEGLVARWIAAHADLVEEEAATIEHYEEEEA